MLGNVTVLIPTFNRPDLLARLLRVLSKNPNVPRLIVADSSDVGVRARNRAMVEGFENHLTYLEYLNTVKPLDKFADALDRVDTPFVLICADDDFLFLESAAECVQF